MSLSGYFSDILQGESLGTTDAQAAANTAATATEISNLYMYGRQ